MHSFVLGEFFNIGGSELVLIIFVALLLFGGEQLPKIARGLGKGIRDFKDATEGVKREINEQINNYEEKRDDEKRTEEAIKQRQELPQYTPVQNTVPLNDSYEPIAHNTPETGTETHHDASAAGEHPAVEANTEHVAETHTVNSEHTTSHTGETSGHASNT